MSGFRSLLWLGNWKNWWEVLATGKYCGKMKGGEPEAKGSCFKIITDMVSVIIQITDTLM